MNDLLIDEFRSEILPKLVELFQPEEVILFGSRVQGTADEESDPDVKVVSESFRNVPGTNGFPLSEKVFVQRFRLIITVTHRRSLNE